jgi:hypothetical protein
MNDANEIVQKSYTDPVTGKFAKGNPGGGRTPGKKNYETEMEEAIKAYAKLNNKTPEDIKLMIYMKGAGEAIKGDYGFYKDYMDRCHGKPLQKTELTGQDGAPLAVNVINYKDAADIPNPPLSTQG